MWLYKRIHFIGVDDSSSGCMGYFEDEMLKFWEEVADYSDTNKKQLKALLAEYDSNYDARYEMFNKLNKD